MGWGAMGRQAAEVGRRPPVAGTEKPPPLTRGLKLIRADMTMPIPVAPGPQQRITDRNPRSRVTIALRTGGGSVVW